MMGYRRFSWGIHLLLCVPRPPAARRPLPPPPARRPPAAAAAHRARPDPPRRRVYGSALAKTAAFGTTALLQTLLMYKVLPEAWKEEINATSSSLVFSAFASIIAFLVVFRQNFSITRYSDGRRTLAAMTASFYTATASAFNCDNGTDQQNWGPRGARERQAAAAAAGELDPAAVAFRRDYAHLVSLLHAACLAWLRCDPSLDNFCAHDRAAPPAWDSSFLPGYSPPWYSYISPFRKVPRRRRHNAASPLHVIGGVSAAEKWELANTAMRQPTLFSKSRARRFLWTSEYMADPAMQRTERRIYALHGALLELLRQRMLGGGLQMVGPIIARIWAYLATAVENFEQCRSLNEAPLPLPWDQVIVVALVVWQFTVPAVSAAASSNKFLACVLSTTVVWILWAVNEVARDVEDPFYNEPNDMPLARLAWNFNERVLESLAASRAVGVAPVFRCPPCDAAVWGGGLSFDALAAAAPHKGGVDAELSAELDAALAAAEGGGERKRAA
jgi:predicted membrane chloride channel (bestrophin family)